MDNMTALVAAFARAYHFINNDVHVFADPLAKKMLKEEEYAAISSNMSSGILFFAPGFEGTDDEALRFIVDRQLSPSVLARSAFSERAIHEAVRDGLKQVIVFACGYDTFSLRAEEKDLTIFDLDLPEMIVDRQNRIKQSGLSYPCHERAVSCDLSQDGWKEELIKAGFDGAQPSASSLLGISYYLGEDAFRKLVGAISSLSCAGSLICFDYPMKEDGAESARNRALADAAGEKMKTRYTFDKICALLGKAGFEIVEHMDADEATDAFFSAYNHASDGHVMAAPKGVGYCLAKKSKL